MARSSRRRLVIRLALLVIAFAPLVWAFVIEPRRLVTERAELDLGLARPLRVVAFGDVHLGCVHVDADRLNDVVDAIAATHPDLVLLLGDLIATRSIGQSAPDPRAAIAPLSRLRARLGVYAVLGNHEHWFDDEASTRAIEEAGIPVLENRALALEDDVWLVGIGDAFTLHDDLQVIESVPEDATLLIATHSPDVFPELPDRASVTFAAHTHGGQVVLPFYGPMYVPSRFGTRYARGRFDEGARRMFVTSGIGTSFLPARFLVPPEILVVTIR